MLALRFPSGSCRPLAGQPVASGQPQSCSLVAPKKRREEIARLSRGGLSPAAAVPAARSSFAAEATEEEAPTPLPPGLNPELVPRHVAIIMDGNSRWARERGLPTSAGHAAGYRSLQKIVRLSSGWGVKVLTVFAFSSENWLRPKTEVDFLLKLFEGVIRENLQDMKRQGVRLCIVGDESKLPPSLQRLAAEAAEATKDNTVIELLVAVSYSGRSDIVQACQKIAQRVRDGTLEPSEITELVIEEQLATNCAINSPYPDLLIRTSGELRLSNFLLWQSAYSELYFSKCLWPDFGEAEYTDALSSYQQRQRRFGLRI